MALNALSGALPGFITSSATLQELDLSNQTNGFTGSIPEVIWRFLSLKVLNLAGNKLNGTIPSTVGNLREIDLSYNELSGVIPSELGQLRGVSVFLKGNSGFDSTAPLSLCLKREVKEFDLADDITLCPPERNALVDFYDSTKSAEWTDRSKWLDEYSYCDWKGITCDDDRNHIIKLNLSNNGLSGRLSDSIGNLLFMEVLDLSDNDIKVM
jgi:Leucine-rich repeat (LRR) protein